MFAITTGKAYILSLAVLIGLGSIAVFSFFGGPLSLLSHLPGPDAATSRIELFGHTIQLCRDYVFTGGGLAGFAGLYSTYIRVIPFFQFNHSHNLFLDVLLEQGIGGLFSLLVILLGSFLLLLPPKVSERDKIISRRIRVFRWAAFTALVTMLLHGMMDDALYGYLGTPLLFVVPGIIVAFSSKYGDSLSPVRYRRRWGIFLSAALIAGISLLVSAGRIIQGIWYANLGAVEMAKIELAEWPTKGWKDASKLPSFQDTVRILELTLSKDTNNFTAHYRLGLVAMLRRDYSTAATHLEAAYHQNSEHRGVVKSLGYCYVWKAEFDKAAALLSEIPEAQQEMEAYIYHWKKLGRSDLSSNAAKMATRLPPRS